MNSCARVCVCVWVGKGGGERGNEWSDQLYLMVCFWEHVSGQFRETTDTWLKVQVTLTYLDLFTANGQCLRGRGMHKTA